MKPSDPRGCGTPAPDAAVIFREDHILFEPLAQMRWLAHCFSTRRFPGGGVPGREGRPLMARALHEGVIPGAASIVWGEQVHGTAVSCVGECAAPPGEIPGADALVCAAPRVCIAAWGADCPIVFLADPVHRAVALIHSGRKGTEGGIVTKGLREMRRIFGTRPAACVAVISPSIGPCCYPVDLWGGIEEELRSLGVPRAVNARLCTSCRSDLFFSYRREKTQCGRMLGAMMIRN